MSKETVLKSYNYYKYLVSEDFTEQDFNQNYGKGGSMTMGEMTPERKQLIVSDAKRKIQELETKTFPNKPHVHPDLRGKLCFPYLTQTVEEVKEEPNVLEKVAEAKKTKKAAK